MGREVTQKQSKIEEKIFTTPKEEESLDKYETSEPSDNEEEQFSPHPDHIPSAEITPNSEDRPITYAIDDIIDHDDIELDAHFDDYELLANHKF
jgi:hypothetical protein